MNKDVRILPREEWWTGKSADKITFAGGHSPDIEVNLTGNLFIHGAANAAVNSVIDGMILQLVQKYSPQRLRLDILDASGTCFSDFVTGEAVMPHVDFMVSSKKTVECMRSLKRVASLVQRRYTENASKLPPHVFIVNEYQRLFNKDNRNAYPLLAGIMSVGPKVGVYTIIVSQGNVSKAPLWNLCAAVACLRDTADVAKMLVGTEIPSSFDKAGQIYIYQPNYLTGSAGTYMPRASSIAEVCKTAVSLATEKEMKIPEPIISFGESAAEETPAEEPAAAPAVEPEVEPADKEDTATDA